jgi:hypothetical protein
MSYGVAERIKRFRESPSQSRDERRRREFQVTSGGATNPINPRMWWEETSGDQGNNSLHYDSDLLGADESIGLSGDFNTLNIEQSALPNHFNSTVPLPYKGHGTPPLQRTHSDEVGLPTGRGGGSGSSKLSAALRDTSAVDVALEDSYSHLQVRPLSLTHTRTLSHTLSLSLSLCQSLFMSLFYINVPLTPHLLSISPAEQATRQFCRILRQQGQRRSGTCCCWWWW